MSYRWDFTPVVASAPLLAEGLVNTLKVTGVSLACGLVLGLALALMRLSRHRLASWPAGFVIEVFRTTPPLVQLFWFFFALPLIVGIEMTPFLAACVTFSIQSAAFFAEVFRAGIQSIERGQWDGARAIGMTHAQALQRIILPQAVKRMIPAFMERAIELMKTTTLVATIAYADLLFAANEMSQKKLPAARDLHRRGADLFRRDLPASQLARLLELRLAAAARARCH